MSDEPRSDAPEEGAVLLGEPQSDDPTPRPWEGPARPFSRRFQVAAIPGRVLVAIGAGLAMVIGANAYLIGRSLHHGGEPNPSDTASATEDAPTPVIKLSAFGPAGAMAPEPSDTPPLTEDEAARDRSVALADDPESGEQVVEDAAPEGSDGDKSNHTKRSKAHAKKANTVLEAISSGCSTSSVDGLSRQIVAEARCSDENAFAPVPAKKNLVRGGAVFLYLEAPARDMLVKALDAHPKWTMTVNSALRTIAQQYLLSRWASTKRCGIQLAATPGESNHESGLALDVREAGTWRPILEKNGFRWHGTSDRVHFDFAGPGAVDHTGLDVLAFQRLWNRNHPTDLIGETSHFDSATEARLKKSPTGGFPTGPRCKKGS